MPSEVARRLVVESSWTNVPGSGSCVDARGRLCQSGASWVGEVLVGKAWEGKQFGSWNRKVDGEGSRLGRTKESKGRTRGGQANGPVVTRWEGRLYVCICIHDGPASSLLCY